MTNYLRLEAPIAPAHRIGATLDLGDVVYLAIDAVLGSSVLACGSDVDTREYDGRFSVVDVLPCRDCGGELVPAFTPVLTVYKRCRRCGHVF